MSIIKDSMKEELKVAIGVSKSYAEKIKDSYTDAKSDFYIKKLKKNNKIVANLVIGLDRIEKKEYNTRNNKS